MLQHRRTNARYVGIGHAGFGLDDCIGQVMPFHEDRWAVWVRGRPRRVNVPDISLRMP